MLQTILADYDLPPPTQTLFLDSAGGFSGSIIWKIEAGDRPYCLRRWPGKFNSKKLHWIHRVLQFAQAHGCPEVVVPVTTKSGATIVHRAGHCWELCHWVQGLATYGKDPNPQRLQSAIETLARFHQATARFHQDFSLSSNLANVIRRLGSFEQSVAAIEIHGSPHPGILTGDEWHFFKTGGRKIAADTLRPLQSLAGTIFPVQPVIRDIRHEHLFFEGDRVCGIIDFGAMQIDTVACDLSRMFGSLIGNDRVQLQRAVETYSLIRPLTNEEMRLIQPMIASGNLIGILNWLHWLVIENREFASIEEVKERVGQLVDGLRNAM